MRSSIAGLLLLAILAACGGEQRGVPERSAPPPTPPGSLLEPPSAWQLRDIPAEILPSTVRAKLARERIWIRDEALAADEWTGKLAVPGHPELRYWSIHPRFAPSDPNAAGAIPGATLRHPRRRLECVEQIDTMIAPGKAHANSYMVTNLGIGVILPRSAGFPDGAYRVSYPVRCADLVRNFRHLPARRGPAAAQRVELGGDARPAWALFPPMVLSTELRVPPGAELSFAIGLQRIGFEPAGEEGLRVSRGCSDGVRFTLSAIASDGRREQLMRRLLRPQEGDRFHDQRLSLERWAGREIRLELALDGGPAGDTRDDFAFFAAPHLHVVADPRPSVVLLVLDTLRADALGCYGNPRPLSPNLDALARTGALFEQARSTSSWTLPAHASLFTSLYPTQHGLEAIGQSLSPSLPTLAAVLRRAGWATAAFTGGGFLSPAHGFAHGFDRFDTRAGGIAPICQRAIDWLQSAPRPFFLFVHSYEVHGPYTPPPSWRARFVAPYGGAAAELDDDRLLNTRYTFAHLAPPHPLAHHIRDLYEAEVAYADSVLGQLFAALDPSTLLIVTSDHGEEFGEHGGFSHGLTLYEEQLHIPLLIRFPGRFTGGQRRATPVTLIDIAPTILDLARLPLPNTWEGTSLSDLKARRDLFATLRSGTSKNEAQALIEGTRKWIRTPLSFYRRARPAGTELYDLSSDPTEQHNLWRAPQNNLLDKRLESLLQRYHRLPIHPSHALTPTPAEALHLQALGYLR